MRPEKHEDERGYFAVTWQAEAFRRAGAVFAPRQISVSSNRRAGTLRGLHWQADPHAQTKLVRATRGRVYDVAADLRPHSPSYGRWFGMEMDAESLASLLVPAGMAHGYLTLTDDATVLYCVDGDYAPSSERGARYDDAALGIRWPRAPVEICARDLQWPPLRLT